MAKCKIAGINDSAFKRMVKWSVQKNEKEKRVWSVFSEEGDYCYFCNTYVIIRFNKPFAEIAKAYGLSADCIPNGKYEFAPVFERMESGINDYKQAFNSRFSYETTANATISNTVRVIANDTNFTCVDDMFASAFDTCVYAIRDHVASIRVEERDFVAHIMPVRYTDKYSGIYKAIMDMYKPDEDCAT